MSLQGGTKQQSKQLIKEPKRYHVIMHNDDYTPMDFVVQVLLEVFNKKRDAAVMLMMTVHKGGKACVGTYSYDIALTKIKTVMEMAEEEGYPFRLTVEEA